MECLALSPLKFSVCSSGGADGVGVAPTSVLVNAHPAATVARLLQYVHWKTGLPGHWREYAFHHADRELAEGTYLQDIEPDAEDSTIELQLRKRDAAAAAAAAGGQEEQEQDKGRDERADATEDLATTGLQISINTLSVEKVMSKTQRVRMDVTIGRLKAMALDQLTDYECNPSGKNLCGLREEHSAADFIMLFVKGRQTPLYLDDENGYGCASYRDMKLSQLLGIDFAPYPSGFFNMVFRVRHGNRRGVECDERDRFTIEFVSDATLAMNQMAVTPETTVEQVKEFVCSAYTHSLRLSPADVRLVYKGQLIHRLDLAGNACKIMEYMKETSASAKLHVYINQEYTEPGPGFWNELFHSPDRFDFMSTRGAQTPASASASASASAPASVPVSTSASAAGPASARGASPAADASSASVSASTSAAAPGPGPGPGPVPAPAPGQEQTTAKFAPESGSNLPSTGRPKVQLVTDAGVPLENLQETYTRCMLLGQQVLVPTQELESFKTELTFGEHTLQLSAQDFVMANGNVILAPHLISKVESILGVRLKEPDASVATTTGLRPASRSTSAPDRLQSWSRLFSGLLLIARTLYLIANYSVIPFFFVLELSTVLPNRYTAGIAVLILLRTIWSTRELWDMWISYFDWNNISPDTYRSVKRHILDKKVTRLFYRDCLAHPMVIDIFMASNLRDERQRLLSHYTFEELNEQNGVQAWHHFLSGVGQGSIRKEPLDEYLISCLTIYENSRDVMPEAYSEPWKQLLKLGQKDMERITPSQQLPRHRRTLRAIQNHVETLRQSQVAMIVLEHVVPDPRQDSIAAGLAKNLALFFLILLPPLKHRVDTILEERKRSREHGQEQDHRQQDGQQQQAQQQEPQELLPDRPGASGAAPHDVDE